MAARADTLRTPNSHRTTTTPESTTQRTWRSGSLSARRSRQTQYLREFDADPRTAPSTKGRTYDDETQPPRPAVRLDLGAAVGRRKKSVGNLLFYGYPPELIAQWCGTTVHTAYLYKIGARKPSKQAQRLFVLHRDGRVLGPEWRDWAVHKNKLVSPEGQETTQSQLNAYWLVMQLAHELTKQDPKARNEFYRILAAG